MISENRVQTDPRWGAENREVKARAILTTVSQFVPFSLIETTWLDMGCGSGGIAVNIAPHVKSMTGVDPESWARWSDFQTRQPNLRFLQESVENLSIENESVDIVICNQVYEHVSDPQSLIAEIYRVLKPGGYCYFAGPNLLFPIEPHVFWPFVHWFPRATAIKIMRFCGSQAMLDAYSTDYWTLRKWLHRFEMNNVIPYIIKNPKLYCRTHIFWTLLSYCPYSLLRAITGLSPGFIFLLKKS